MALSNPTEPLPGSAKSTLDAADPIDPSGRDERAVDIERLNLTRSLDDQDYELTRDFLARRATLPATARERLALSLARRLAQKTGQPLPAAIESEAFLETIAAALHQRH
jgi:hypothetical protein